MKTINEKGEVLAFSETENLYPKTYEELCVFLETFRQPIESGEGKIYNSELGKAVWANIVTRKRPPKCIDTIVTESVYQLIGELGFNGDFPAMLYLYDRLDISESEYNGICKDKSDERNEIFRWAREVFTHASKINAVHGNGNVSVFQYVNMSDGLDDGSGETSYTTPVKDIGSLLSLFGELAVNNGKVGEVGKNETDV